MKQRVAPEKPEDVSTDHRTLTIRFVCPQVSPVTVFGYWIEPDKLTRWWPQEAHIDPRPGGAYQLSWPGMNLHLRGTYTVLRPGRHLGFTWSWEHEPEKPIRSVEISLHGLGAGGTEIVLTHGTYNETHADNEERVGHLEGWMHFLPRLQAACIEE